MMKCQIAGPASNKCLKYLMLQEFFLNILNDDFLKNLANDEFVFNGL